MVDLFCHNLGVIKTHALRCSFAKIEPMKKLLLLPTIFVLVSCQPSELERCVESNSESTDLDTTAYNYWGKIELYKRNYGETEYYYEWNNSLSDHELMIKDCLNAYGETLAEGETINESDVKACFSKAETEKATKVCNSQGIY